MKVLWLIANLIFIGVGLIVLGYTIGYVLTELELIGSVECRQGLCLR